MSEVRLVNVDQMAEILQVPKSWLYSRVRQKGPDAIPRIKCGKYVRFDPNKVLEYLQRNETRFEA
jgi:predicted DNA-binding transcriptional regulator AlpA